MLIILSGSSGSGKNTIIKEIIKQKPYVQIMKSCTTRKQRDKEDNAYFFLSEDEFKNKMKNGDFFEVEEVHKGLYYGILKDSLKDVSGSQIYLKDVDVNGAMKLKKELKKNVKLVYLDVNKDILRQRILKRGESENSADLRLSRFEYERSFAGGYDLVIKNENLSTTAKLIIEKFKI